MYLDYQAYPNSFSTYKADACVYPLSSCQTASVVTFRVGLEGDLKATIYKRVCIGQGGKKRQCDLENLVIFKALLLFFI